MIPSEISRPQYQVNMRILGQWPVLKEVKIKLRVYHEGDSPRKDKKLECGPFRLHPFYGSTG